MMKATDNTNLRSRGGRAAGCCTNEEDSFSESYDVEAAANNLSFEDFSERLIEDEEDDKKIRKQQRRSVMGCALMFVGVCAMLFFAASKTLAAAEVSVSNRSPAGHRPVQRYQSIHKQQTTTTRRF